MARKPEPAEVLVVDRQEQVDDFCAHARDAGRFAFDTEFVMEDVFETELCLVQLAVRDSVAIIDPFLRLDLAPVWALVADQNIETVVHAGQEDLALSVQHTGQMPRRIFDVQIAAGLAGLEYPLSLQRLVQALAHVRLHKSKTLTDWRRRPLAPAQIGYAAEDVRYLVAMRDKLNERLRRLNRTDWAEEEFARFEDAALYHRAEEEKLFRVKGAGSLHDAQLAIARDLLLWREELAKRYNRPVRIVLKDHLLVEIARLELSTPQEIRDLRGINLGDRDVRALCDVVDRARKTPRASWPKPLERILESAEDTALIALLTAILRGYCDEHEIAYGLVGTKDSIRELVQRGAHPANAQPAETPLLLSGWRGRTVGRMLTDVLEGRCAIRVAGHAGRRLIRVVDG